MRIGVAAGASPAGGRSGRRHTALALALLIACAQPHVDRARWQHMSPSEKTLYVRTLLGHEKVKEAKGGNGRTFDRPAEEYARRIDEAYARGERRDADTIFEEMGSKR